MTLRMEMSVPATFRQTLTPLRINLGLGLGFPSSSRVRLRTKDLSSNLYYALMNLSSKWYMHLELRKICTHAAIRNTVLVFCTK